MPWKTKNSNNQIWRYNVPDHAEGSVHALLKTMISIG